MLVGKKNVNVQPQHSTAAVVPVACLLADWPSAGTKVTCIAADLSEVACFFFLFIISLFSLLLPSALKSFSPCCYRACFFCDALPSVHLLMPLLHVLITDLSMASAFGIAINHFFPPIHCTSCGAAAWNNITAYGKDLCPLFRWRNRLFKVILQ